MKIYQKQTIIGQSIGTLTTQFGVFVVQIDYIETTVRVFGFVVQNTHTPLRVHQNGFKFGDPNSFEVMK